jgi:hypothetical protein
MKATIEFTLIFIVSLMISNAVLGQTYATLPFSDDFGNSNPTASLGSSWTSSSTISNGLVESRSDVSTYATWHRIQFPSDGVAYTGASYSTSYGTPANNVLLFYNTVNQSAANYISADLYVNLNGGTGVQAKFNVGDWGTSGTGDYRDVLRFYISTNGGSSFGTNYTEIDLGASPYNDGTWNSVTVDINALATANSLTLSATSVIRMTAKLRRRAVLNSMRSDANRQYIAIDNLSVTGTTTLPVQLNYFTGLKEEDKTLLSWQTVSEINNDYFSIERSVDGVNFEKIGEVSGQGSSNAINDYSFTDENPLHGINYYRLQQIDFDGTSAYSITVAVDFGGKQNLTVYPNPSNGHFSIELNDGFVGEILMYNAIGELVYQQKVNNEFNLVVLSLTHLSKGNYLLCMVNKTAITSTKISINN